MSYLVISTSLRYASLSRRMGKYLSEKLHENGLEGSFLDLRHYPLPMASGERATEEELLQINHLRTLISAADAIILATPIYNYGVNSICHNLIALTNADENHPITWQNKVIGLVAAAGGPGSYMSPLSILNSLMLDYRCVVIPSYVYANASHFIEDSPGEEVTLRLNRLADEVKLFSHGLNGYIHSGVSTS